MGLRRRCGVIFGDTSARQDIKAVLLPCSVMLGVQYILHAGPD
jgi:hypothetical protein